jgi:hypothetical protein
VERPGEGAQDRLLVRRVRIAEEPRLRASVEQVDQGPRPGHRPGQSRDLADGERAGDLRPSSLDDLATDEVELAEVPAALARILAGSARGRTLVRVP